MPITNELGQPVGEPLGGWDAPPFPPGLELNGEHVLLRPLDVDRDTAPLHAAFRHAPPTLWTYMTFGPFPESGDLRETLTEMTSKPDWITYMIETEKGAEGFASYLRIVPDEGVIEIGAITLSPGLQRTTAATEALYLMIRHVFELGYRRCEWKCDVFNRPSREAAERLGFSYEGTFRQATHYKGRNRDTAWYAIVDQEWPRLDEAFRRWLSPSNFDVEGLQRQSLREIREMT